MKANYQGEYITKHYYIIKVICDNGKYTYYKIGEANNRHRPDRLVEKYRALRANDAELLAFEELPTYKDTRLQDKNIHLHIDASILRKANSMQMAYLLKEEDGKDEFFEAVQPLADQEVIDYVKGIVASISCSEYTGKRIKIKNATLDYDPEKYHLVNSKLIENYILTIPEVYNIVYEATSKSVLLIGQFEQDFICSIACFHNLYIWHDTKEQIHDFSLQRINNRITYIESLEELLDLEMKFDLIIANPPYNALGQKIGTTITRSVLDNVEFDTYVNLEPVTDYLKDETIIHHIDLNSLKSITKAFSDAEVLPSICVISKDQKNNLSKDDFYLFTICNDLTKKYFTSNVTRKDVVSFNEGVLSSIDMTRSLVFGIKLTPPDRSYHDLFGKTNNTMIRRINSFKQTIQETIDNQISKGRKGSLWLVQFAFNSIEERTNAYNFIFSSRGSRFCNMLVTSMCRDNYHDRDHRIWFPKVDWSRAWTVEEILENYNYTPDEIINVLNEIDSKDSKGNYIYNGVN